jgi:hypothetical protein
MLKRTIVLFSFGVAAVLFGVAQTEAQPGGKVPKFKGDEDLQKLAKDVAKLLEQVKDITADLARIKGDAAKKGLEGKKGFGPGGPGGFGGFGKGPEKLDPDTIKQKYDFYKKLYDELPKEKGKGYEGKYGFGGRRGGYEGWRKAFEGNKGPEGKGPGGKIEARIDRLIRELEELRSELRNAKGGADKKGLEPKKKFGREEE